MIKPSISVVIPLYNKAPYIERALRSVVAQKFNEFEILVIDDGSTDDGAEVVKKFHDHRINLISQSNSGVSAARNRGIIESRSDYIAFLDADDEWKPEYLDTIWRLKHEYPDVHFFAAAYEVIYENGKRIHRNFNSSVTSMVNLMEYLDCCVRKGAPVWTSAVMIRKHLLLKVGMFPVGQRRGEDLDTWFRLLTEGPLVYYNKPLATYWCELPFSASTYCNDVYLKDNSLLQTLEYNIFNGMYTRDELSKVIDYIAWYMAGPIDRLITAGERLEARKHIKTAFRSKRFRKQYLAKYVKSWLPLWMLACVRRI